MAALLVLVGCGSNPDPTGSVELNQRVATLESKTDAIQADQQRILAALQRIEAGLAKPRSASPAAAPGPPVKVTIDVGSSPTRGPQQAAVTLVVFSDFQCPYCAKLEPTLAQVLAAYPSDVRVVFKQFPLGMHPNARPAALASLAAGQQGKFWEMHDLLFQNSADLSRAKLEALALTLGLDVPAFVAAMDGPTLAQQVDSDLAQGRAANVRGTPSLFVNGWLATNRSLDGLRALIDRELGRSPAPEAEKPAESVPRH